MSVFCTVSAPAIAVRYQPEEKVWYSLLPIRFKIADFIVLLKLCEFYVIYWVQFCEELQR